MELLWWIAAKLFCAAWFIVSWLLWQLLWLILWTILPLALAAIICVLVAERALGTALLRPWIRTHVFRIAAGVGRRARSAAVALAALPVRVLCWFVIYALWHSLVNLWWTPRWRPWERAWNCRWGHRSLALART